MNFPSAFPSADMREAENTTSSTKPMTSSSPNPRRGMGPGREHRPRAGEAQAAWPRPPPGRTLTRTVRILGHRGASSDAPENTLAAFQLALEQGADGVELDARVCASGEVVVFHDERLERLTGGRGRVADTRWSDLG